MFNLRVESCYGFCLEGFRGKPGLMADKLEGSL